MWVCVCVCVCVFSPVLFSVLCNLTDCSPPGSSVHGIPQAGILEQIVISFSRRSSQWSNSSLLCLLHWQEDSLSLSHLGCPLEGMIFPKSICLNSKYKRKLAFRKIREWGVSMTDVEEIRLVPLFHVFTPIFLSHVCVCVCVCVSSNKQTGQFSPPIPHWYRCLTWEDKLGGKSLRTREPRSSFYMLLSPEQFFFSHCFC